MIKRIIFIILFSMVFNSISIAQDIPEPSTAIAAEKQGEWQKAVNLYMYTLNKNPNLVDLWVRVAQIEYVRLKQYPHAIEAMKHAIAIQPGNPNFHYTLSQIYTSANESAGALLEINEAVKLDPTNLEYLKSQAKFAGWSQDWQTALDAYQKILAVEPKYIVDSPQFYAGISQIYASNNQAKESFEAIVQAVKLDPNNIVYLQARADIANWNKNWVIAKESYERILAIKPNYREKDALFHVALSQIYAQANQPKKALAEINLAVTLEPKNVEYLKAQAVLANWSNDPKAAKAAYQKILAAEPANKEALLGLQNIKKASAVNIKNIPEKKLGPVETLVANASEHASRHNYSKAAAAMKKAITKRPNDPALYVSLSQIYAISDQPLLALDAMNHALELDPNNLKYLRAKVQLANWGGDTVQALSAYKKILELEPIDKAAMLGLARAYSWTGQINKAISAYRRYLNLYPYVTPAAWIEYAENLSWADNFRASLKALDKYKQYFGISRDYLKVRARVLTGVRYYKSALAINNALLHATPNDPYLLITNVYAEDVANRRNSAVAYLNRVNEVDPNSKPTKSLNTTFPVRYKSNLNLGANYFWGSDTVRIAYFPFSYQHFLSPSTSLIVEGKAAHLYAANGSGLDTINGDTSISALAAMAGFTTQIHGINLKAVAGDMQIRDASNHGIYDLIANTYVGEKLMVTLERFHEIFQPYLTPPSPRSVSLGIMEGRNAATFNWQPRPQDYVNLFVDYSTLSDGNAYWHISPWPKTRIYSSQHLLVTVGIFSDFWAFNERLSNGYYSPKFFQEYEGTIELFIPKSTNVVYGIWFGVGVQKDEVLPHFYPAKDIGANAIFGVFSNWQLALNGGYVYRGGQFSNYNGWSVAGVLTRRF